VFLERHGALEVACESSVVENLWRLQSSKKRAIAAAVQRIAIEAERHRFTLRQTRRTVFMTFSICWYRRASAAASSAIQTA
jgi:hypothetical protein